MPPDVLLGNLQIFGTELEHSQDVSLTVAQQQDGCVFWQIVRQSLLASEEDSREQTAAADAATENGRPPDKPGACTSPAAGPGGGSGELEGSIRHRASAAVYLAPRFCLLDFRQEIHIESRSKVSPERTWRVS